MILFPPKHGTIRVAYYTKKEIYFLIQNEYCVFTYTLFIVQLIALKPRAKSFAHYSRGVSFKITKEFPALLKYPLMLCHDLGLTSGISDLQFVR